MAYSSPNHNMRHCKVRRYTVTVALLSVTLGAGCAGSQNVSTTLPTSAAIINEAKSRGLLFVANTYANYTGEVDVFPLRPGKQIETITNGLYYPVGVGVDSAQNLYVANAGLSSDQGFVTEYAPPYTGAPIATYSQGLSSAATGVAIGTDGSVYVSEYSGGTVVEYAPKSTKPSAELTFNDYPGILGPGGSGSPEGLALDARNRLYVAVNFPASSAAAVRFDPGATKGHLDVSLPGPGFSGGVTFDATGNLLAIRQGSNVHARLKRYRIPPTIYVFAPGKKIPSRRIDDHFAQAFALAFDHNQTRLYVSGSVIKVGPNFLKVAPEALKIQSEVYCVSYPSGKLLYKISYPAGTLILGVAVTPPAPK
jgi:hypothetical protein